MRRRLGIALLALLSFATGLSAQESASSGIVGQVIDSTKAAMPGATVTVTNVGTNAQRVTNTDAEGRFSVPNLPPATYTVRVELSGFADRGAQRSDAAEWRSRRPTMTLGLANVAETVTVVGMSPLLQTTNASVSQTISQKQIEDLPVAGRNLLAFASLSAGVTPQSFNRGTQFGAAGSSRSQYVTVEGGRDSSTNYAIDGVYVRSLRFNNLSLNPPLDAVQEVNDPPQFVHDRIRAGTGRRLDGDQVRLNSISGSAYDYVRDDGTESANFFGQKPGDERRPAATLGGPLMREQLLLSSAATRGFDRRRARRCSAAVPSPALLPATSPASPPINDPLTGLPFPGNIIPSSRFSNFAKTLAPDRSRSEHHRREQLRTINAFNDDADTATCGAIRCSARPQPVSSASCTTKGAS